VLNKTDLRQLKQRVALRCNMHALPNVEEVERYITERLLIAGSEQPNIFTPGAIDFIFQCSDGIPRQINNLCDNALLAGYAAGEQVIGRQIIEQVADNLDLLPSQDNLILHERKAEEVQSSRVMKPQAREELWGAQSRVEHAPKSNGSHSVQNGNGNGHAKADPFADIDDEVSLEIEEIGGFY
jgi:general secretion pathway protein A